MNLLVKILIVLLAITTPGIALAQASDADWMWAQKATLSNGLGENVNVNASGNIYVSGPCGGYAVFGKDTMEAADQGSFTAKYTSNGILQWTKPVSFSINAFDKAGNMLCLRKNDTSLSFSKYDSSASALWTKTIGLKTSSNYFILSGITTDSTDNTYVTGYFLDSVQLGSYALNASYWGLFTMKYSQAGDLQWVKVMNSDTGQKGICIAADRDGTTYTGGVGWGNSCFLLMKRNTAGDLQWTARGVGRDVVPLSVIPDKEGNVYVAGVFHDTAVFGDHILMNPMFGEDYFIAKYTSEGECIWARKIDRWLADGGYFVPITLDKYGNLFMAGSTWDSIAIGNVKLIGRKEKNNYVSFSFIVKFDAKGNLIWVKKQDNTNIHALCMDNEGNICAVGELLRSAMFGTEVLNGNMFVGKMTAGPEDAPVIPVPTNEIALYPNPSDGNFTVKLEGTGYTYIRIFDQLGRCIYSDPVSNGGPYKKISLKNNAAGVYYLRATGDNMSTTGKIIVK